MVSKSQLLKTVEVLCVFSQTLGASLLNSPMLCSTPPTNRYTQTDKPWSRPQTLLCTGLCYWLSQALRDVFLFLAVPAVEDKYWTTNKSTDSHWTNTTVQHNYKTQLSSSSPARMPPWKLVLCKRSRFLPPRSPNTETQITVTWVLQGSSGAHGWEWHAIVYKWKT